MSRASNTNNATLSTHSSLVSSSRNAASAQEASRVEQIANDLINLNSAARLSSAAAAVSAASGSREQQSSASATASDSNCKAAAFLSEVETAILRSNVPVEVNESEEITVLGQRGIWANRAEVVNWKGDMALEEYQINEDADPEVITKQTEQRLEYVQELAIRYLRPPTPPPPGEILISQECNTLTPPAPPIIIRQQPCRPDTPEVIKKRNSNLKKSIAGPGRKYFLLLDNFYRNV